MTAREVLLIDRAWEFSPDDPYDVLASVQPAGVVLRRAGTDEALVIRHPDWAALVAFVLRQIDWI